MSDAPDNGLEKRPRRGKPLSRRDACSRLRNDGGDNGEKVFVNDLIRRESGVTSDVKRMIIRL